MNKEAFLRLADALDSGEFEQTYDRLGSNGKFCAVGVACEIFGPELNLFREEIDGLMYYGDPGRSYGGSSCISPVTLKMFMDPETPNDSLLNDVMGWNDFDGMTFPEIAAEIRKRVNQED